MRGAGYCSVVSASLVVALVPHMLLVLTSIPTLNFLRSSQSSEEEPAVPPTLHDHTRPAAP